MWCITGDANVEASHLFVGAVVAHPGAASRSMQPKAGEASGKQVLSRLQFPSYQACPGWQLQVAPIVPGPALECFSRHQTPGTISLLLLQPWNAVLYELISGAEFQLLHVPLRASRGGCHMVERALASRHDLIRLNDLCVRQRVGVAQLAGYTGCKTQHVMNMRGRPCMPSEDILCCC